MNLQRNLVLQEVKGLFGYKSIQIQEKYNANPKEVVQSFGQIIVNLHLENKIFLNDFQKDVEQLLEQIRIDYKLSYVELVEVLTESINQTLKYQL
ncbi:hypothetical protein [Parageobacillus thermoglucosidasius]|uniref:hypothetical protein n=1 Tax=Parageobacillus thermoglucosidasius TaxID=1426 RepID=UPI000E16F4B2|nr:hypothetical protein [Parageobacillus thermoglucosidasius]RDE19286.1 hypothetical protein DV714_19725 [Parageobacillus thermoglucosidasius]